MVNESDADLHRLIDALRLVDLKTQDIDEGGSWNRPAALRVIDCVLSLRRNYKKFVVPRLDVFQKEHPDATSVADLRRLMDSYPSPHAFMQTTLNYNHEARAGTLYATVTWLVGVNSLEEWALLAKPTDHKTLGIHGFGLAAFQYLRMLFGADTTKPDVHICRYVESHIGRAVTPLDALDLLERVASFLKVTVRSLARPIREIAVFWSD